MKRLRVNTGPYVICLAMNFKVLYEIYVNLFFALKFLSWLNAHFRIFYVTEVKH